MKMQSKSELGRVFAQWLDEDRRLATCIDEVRQWMSEVNQLGIPHFGETASRLEPARECLTVHFDREVEMLEQLKTLYPEGSPEVSAFTRQTLTDHERILNRLSDLCGRLTQVDPPFESWTSAMDEVDLFFEELELHERLESDRVSMLMPGECDVPEGLL